MIDELGYLTYGPDAANVLFHVVNDRHLRKRPMIFTTNKPLREWGKVLHDDDMAAAILDRVLERGRLIHLDGPSGRTRHLNLEETLPAAVERARISGISVPEFPEPTAVMSGGRIPFAVARDRYFFKALGEVHPRFHTPALALIVQAALAVVLVLVGGAFRELFSLAIFAEWLFYAVAASTIFVFRKREPNRPKPYRTVGYPIVPALFIGAAGVLLFYTFVDNLRNSIAGLVVILTGIPVFFYFDNRRAGKQI